MAAEGKPHGASNKIHVPASYFMAGDTCQENKCRCGFIDREN